ncbi:D-alanyl-D-alanine carboxypeptidase/D-alanyl-D-alanine-endopeptidase [Ornithinimicrobium sp. INDO-MA30-4]|uniref:D-alanyl-D-alanine carboxypeptidase/D-alanyl-D-alanine-endopeptidase n=1 Tax=Ornithinimicrobium sp. INDO-MA30-4 TaxID=2908651 RepID=UPI001F3B3E2A|nr:D-alanyl-D-alanine carboxypeptidase [Ornithinimicrobium sp. INDO-MA30-4]UJH70494.1 D-alanyl-D-alanine carboxypeptidase [Ornithinimicrobium sp. INDO-MA30-4]
MPGVALAALAAGVLCAPMAVAQTNVEGDGDVLAAQAAIRPTVTEPVAEPGLAALTEGTAVDPLALEPIVSAGWSDDALGDVSDRALTIRDVESGEALYDIRANKSLTPASTTKLLTAAAVVTQFDPLETLKTSVVLVPQEGAGGDSESATATASPSATIALVAGGDMLLSAGNGNANNVVGHAGITDLARQTAAALEMQGIAGPITISLDTSYASGASTVPAWTDYWVTNGFAGRITMLGFADDRALPFDPSPRDPAMVVAEAFVQTLSDEGVDVVSGDIERAEAPGDAGQIAMVESAPLAEVLGVGLRTSDNAMLEQLARQATVRAGESGEQESVNAWVTSQIKDVYGVDTTGVQLSDTSGLSDGTTIPVRVLGDLLVHGASGQHPAFQDALDELPIAGLNGTLFDRFLTDAATEGKGVIRAKTGSLPEVTALAGYIVTDDGRLLAFALTDNDVGIGGDFLNARAQIDSILADVADCGC